MREFVLGAQDGLLVPLGVVTGMAAANPGRGAILVAGIAEAVAGCIAMVFVTPTWVSGALRMPRNTFLVWNAFAAIVSTCVATLGAYGIGAAVLGKLSAKQGTIALVIAGLTLAAVAVGVLRRRRSPPSGEQR